MEVEVLDWPEGWGEVNATAYPKLNAHHAAWVSGVADGLNHRSYLIRVVDHDDVVGLLPLMLVKGPIFGRFLVSLPYVNTGGVWAKTESIARTLIDHACDLADQLDVKYLELRHESPVQHERLNFVRTDKFHMRLQLPDTADELLKSFKSKHRSQIKKSADYHLQVDFGGEQFLPEFYSVFARNMRDLGTPVFAKRLFSSLLHEFAGDAEICLVKKEGQTIAAALLVHLADLSEVPSASSLREFNRTNANMLMYWHLLQRTIQRGNRTFDFGRSSESSGTYRFKRQWGATPSPANWQYYVRSGSPEDMRPDSQGKQRLVKVWQRLPVPLTKWIGPTIVRGIP